MAVMGVVLRLGRYGSILETCWARWWTWQVHTWLRLWWRTGEVAEIRCLLVEESKGRELYIRDRCPARGGQ